jgi:hypothetical protein
MIMNTENACAFPGNGASESLGTMPTLPDGDAGWVISALRCGRYRTAG